MLKTLNDLDEKHRGKLLAIIYASGILYSITGRKSYIVAMLTVAGPLFFLDVSSILYCTLNKENEDSQ